MNILRAQIQGWRKIIKCVDWLSCRKQRRRNKNEDNFRCENRKNLNFLSCFSNFFFFPFILFRFTWMCSAKMLTALKRKRDKRIFNLIRLCYHRVKFFISSFVHLVCRCHSVYMFSFLLSLCAFCLPIVSISTNISNSKWNLEPDKAILWLCQEFKLTIRRVKEFKRVKNYAAKWSQNWLFIHLTELQMWPDLKRISFALGIKKLNLFALLRCFSFRNWRSLVSSCSSIVERIEWRRITYLANALPVDLGSKNRGWTLIGLKFESFSHRLIKSSLEWRLYYFQRNIQISNRLRTL